MGKNELFKQRWTEEWRRFSKYLKYVFNDHAVIAFFFLFGALLFAYHHILQTLPVTWWTQTGLAMLLLLTLLCFKTPANFVKPADAIFFLGNDQQLKQLWQTATHYSMLVNGAIEAGLMLIFWPLMLKLFPINVFMVVGITIMMMVIKMGITYRKAHQVAAFKPATPELMNWRAIASFEEQRLNTIYTFFNLFVDVPGLQSTIKSHPWLERLRPYWPGYHREALLPMYVTTFMRKQQYLGLWVRTLVLGSILIPFTNGYLLLILLALLEYLFIAQLIPLVGGYRRLIFDYVIPVDVRDRQRAFHQLGWPLIVVVNLVWAVILLICQTISINQGFIMILLVIFGLSLVFLYSDRIIANTFKRRVKHASKK
ncbi:ABC transporter permease [Weissella viridescens]|nr:ABC transporter permease [Weissella viridescens]